MKCFFTQRVVNSASAIESQPVIFYSPINYFSKALMSSLRSVASFLSKKKEGETQG